MPRWTIHCASGRAGAACLAVRMAETDSPAGETNSPDNVFAGTMNAEKHAALWAVLPACVCEDLNGSRCLLNQTSTIESPQHAFIDAMGNRFYFRQLGHGFIVGLREAGQCGQGGWQLTLGSRHFAFFFASRDLQAAPLLKVDEAEDQSDHKDANRGVFNQVELAIFFFGLVDNNAVDLAGYDAILSLDGASRHDVEINASRSWQTRMRPGEAREQE